MASTAAVEMSENRHPTSHPEGSKMNRLRGSRSLPELSHADGNLQNTYVTLETAAPSLPANVPASTAAAIPIEQIGQPATTATTTELHGSTQSLELSHSDNSLQSASSMPALVAAAVSPFVPASKGTDYNYLEKVKELCDEIRPDLFDELFEKHFQEGHGEVFLISKEVTRRVLPSSTDPDARWEHLARDYFLRYGFTLPTEPIAEQDTPKFSFLRNLVTSATQENPHILIVEGIDRTGVQVLGTSFDVDPCFVAQHLGTIGTRRGTSHHSEMEILSQQFKNFVNHRNRVPSYAEEDAETTPQDWPGYNMDGVLLKNAITKDQAEIVFSWARAGTERLDLSAGMAFLRPRVSCHQISRYVWIILVDSMGFPARSGQPPFDNHNMIRLGMQELPMHLEDDWFHLAELIFTGLGIAPEALATRRLLPGGSDWNRPGLMDDTYLAIVIVISAWQINVQYLEDRFDRSRHDAIANPSLRTFHPLTLLRRNIADLEDALITARKRMVKTARGRDRNQGALELFGPQYDALLQRVTAMSTKLNNEIQLVIGSVTVQDSDIMKTQARRATLLTILAVIYLPLTLVTGIFGMNIKEINDGAPRFWACILGLVFVGGGTMAGFFGYRYWRRGHDARQGEEREREAKVYKLA